MPRPKSFIFQDKRRKRWGRLKKSFLTASLLFTCVAFALGYSLANIPKFNLSITYPLGIDKKEIIDKISTAKEDTIEVPREGTFVNIFHINSSFFLERFNPPPERKSVVLTFDDGPDPIFTPEILEILEREQVRAIFFVVGEQVLKHPSIVNQTINDGHIVGTHTFTHIPPEEEIYGDTKKINFEMDLPQKLLQAKVGVETKVFRVPYWGAEDTISLNSLVLAVSALERGYVVMPPTVDSEDWKETDKNKVVQNSLGGENLNVVLLHDSGGDRSTTISALPEIIKTYRELGYVFEDPKNLFTNFGGAYGNLSKTERFFSYLSVYAYIFERHFFEFLNPIFKYSLFITTSSIGILILLSLLHIIVRKRYLKNTNYFPRVSVIIPAYNEEATIVKTVQSCLSSHYPNFEVVVVNNNSVDKTREKVKSIQSPKVRLVSEKKQGKFNALNKGVNVARGEILVIVDADTQIYTNTIFNIVQPFSERCIGAVAGNLKVGNISNFLTAFQAVEYLNGIHLDRRAHDILRASIVVPGALGAWRKKALLKAGPYRGDTLTEDADMTVRVQKKGYRITFADQAIGVTEAPENINAFLRQRFRWTYGMLQVIYKNREILFDLKYGTLGLILLPYITFLQLPFMFISPIIDILAIFYLTFVSPHPIVDYFLLFLIFYTLLTLLAFILAKEKRFWLLALLPLKRFIYQAIWYYTLYKSVVLALKGVFVPWAKLAHYGKVKMYSLQLKV